MKCWGLRASSLSAVTKADAGQKTSNNHLNPNILYMMLWPVVHSFFVYRYVSFLAIFINFRVIYKIIIAKLIKFFLCT